MKAKIKKFYDDHRVKLQVGVGVIGVVGLGLAYRKLAGEKAVTASWSFFENGDSKYSVIDIKKANGKFDTFSKDLTDQMTPQLQKAIDVVDKAIGAQSLETAVEEAEKILATQATS
jgi:hypothetical protein